ncbi:MAG TPA: NUDIX hydrolase [Candidatus Kapabacteria bacterium]|nr:NUDIX hydrolase [Candidatus Kapabacteria bacterium]
MTYTFQDNVGIRYPLKNDELIEWRISAYTSVLSSENDILMVVPVENEQYELPGGALKPREEMKNSMIREYVEETGYTIRILSHQPFYIAEDWFYHKGKQKFYHSLLLYFQGEIDNNVPRKDI